MHVNPSSEPWCCRKPETHWLMQSRLCCSLPWALARENEASRGPWGHRPVLGTGTSYQGCLTGGWRGPRLVLTAKPS